MSPGALEHLPACSADFVSRKLLSGSGAPTGTQAQLTLLEPGGAGGSAGGATPGAETAMQLRAQYPGAGPMGIVAVMEKAYDAPAARVSGAVHENGTAAGAGTQPSGGAMVIGAGSAAAGPMNMLSLSKTSPLNGSDPLLVMVTPNVQSAPGAHAAGAVFTTVSCVPPSAQASPYHGAPSTAQLRKP